jgi:hypothetical protein
MTRTSVSALTVVISAHAAFGQPLVLDTDCTVTVGNQTALVRSDGTFLVRNVSIFQSRDTGIAPQLYRVRATCIRDGVAITGQSAFFSLTPGETGLVADVFPSDLDPIPVRIEVTSPAEALPRGESAQLAVAAVLPDGSRQDVTQRSTGTTYLSTNPNLLTVTENGLVTGNNASSFLGTGSIAVLHEGNVATVSIRAVGPSNDFDNDGMPNDFEQLFGLNQFANDAGFDLDGDGLTNLEEFQRGTLPNDRDTDMDGIADGVDGNPLHPEESPPVIAITSPADGSTLVEGETLRFAADASDDGLLTSVTLSTDTGFSVMLAMPPYVVDFEVPVGPKRIVFSARAEDSVGNQATTSSQVSVVPDPLTTVVGVVLAEDGLPAAGAVARVRAPGMGDFEDTAAADGSFEIAMVTTVFGDIVVDAALDLGGGQVQRGSSAAFSPVRGGVTDVATIRLSTAAFDPELGSNLLQGDDDFDLVTFSQGFSFPYFGVNQTSVFVNSNGNLTFGGGDTTFDPVVPGGVVNSLARISPLFTDIDPRFPADVTGGVYFKQLPERFVVTWNRLPLFSQGGDNTFQAILFADGRIQFGYNGLTADGNIRDLSVAVSPGGNPVLRTVDYSLEAPFDSAGGEAVFENFAAAGSFDLDGGFLVFTPNAAGGFNVRFVPPSMKALRAQGPGAAKPQGAPYPQGLRK